jgi:hypothetical protein
VEAKYTMKHEMAVGPRLDNVVVGNSCRCSIGLFSDDIPRSSILDDVNNSVVLAPNPLSGTAVN